MSTKQEGETTFLKWWEGKRILFNLIFLIGFVLVILFFGNIPYIDFVLFIKVLMGLLLFINILYSIFSLISYSYRLLTKEINTTKLDHFSQSKVFWKFLFFIQILIAVIGVLIIVGGGSAVAPMNPSYIH